MTPMVMSAIATHLDGDICFPTTILSIKAVETILKLLPTMITWGEHWRPTVTAKLFISEKHTAGTANCGDSAKWGLCKPGR